MSDPTMYPCRECTAEYTSPLAAELCGDDDNDRHSPYERGRD